MPTHDDNFVRYVLQTGMATDAQIAAARKRLRENSTTGNASTLSEVMVREGIITTAQRETVERKLKAQAAGVQQLGTYKLIKKLGEGGMGAVYLAEDTVGLRQVALKVLSRKYSGNPEFLGRFRREAQALGRLNHPNIVAGFNVGEDKGYQYYVMEYCEGEPLDKRLRRLKRLSIDDAIEITIQVARGLQYAHEHNTIHRDIKPGNLFATNDALIKILDMGLSKTIGEADSSFNTQAGVTVGTPHYISPEQARGEQTIDGRADIYSLGATLYHLVTGRTPFEGPTSVVIMTKHLNEQLENPADLRPECPDGLVQVITRMMAKKPGDRYRTCAELIEDLEQVALGRVPSSPALDPIHSSVGMRSLRIGTGTYKPVGAEREVTEPRNKRATAKREPVVFEREAAAEPGKRATGKRDPVSGERQMRTSGPQDKSAALRKSGRLSQMPAEPLVENISLSPQPRRRIAPSGGAPVAPPKEAERPADAPQSVASPKPAAEAVDARDAAEITEVPAEAEVTGTMEVAEAQPRHTSPPKPAESAAKPAPLERNSDEPQSGGHKNLLGLAAAVVVLIAAGVLYVTLGDNRKPVVIVSTAGSSSVRTASGVSTQTTAAVLPAAVNSAPPKRNELADHAAEVETLVRNRDFSQARERLDALARDVAEKDTYNASWCARLDRLDRSIQNAEQTLKQEFKKQLITPSELPAMPANGILLFNASGTDARIKWSPRTIKFFSGKIAWVDGQGDSKVMTFEAPDGLLTPGPNGRIVFEYNGTLACDGVVKFQTSDEKWSELPVSFQPGRLKKVEVTPGLQFFKGKPVSKISIEFNNPREDGLAMYQIYLLK